MTSADIPRAFKRDGRIVIVGASLAGLRAAEALRDEGFTGSLTMIGDEPGEPYDRPPLSKQVLTGWVPAGDTALPRRRDIDAQWLLGVPASGLDRATHHVRLADGREIPFDRVLISTGVRARPWFVESEAALDGVFVVRTREHAEGLQRALAAGPSRVLVIGAGFTGSEIASVCRERDIPVTVAELGAAPLAGALGAVIGEVAADMQRAHGVDLRCGVKVTRLEGDARGRFRRAHFDDGSTIDADVAVVALGSIRNTEWLRESGLAAGVWGITCDTGCRALDSNGHVTDDVFAAGDVARCPNPVYENRLISLEHWANAVEQAEVAAHNMVTGHADRRPYLSIPVFWSIQFGVNIKSVGVPTFADEVVVTHGSLDDHRFVTAYGHRGRVTAAVSFNSARWLDHYRRLIETGAPFPPPCPTPDRPADMKPVPVDFPGPALFAQGATVVVTGHDPGGRRVTAVRRHRQEEGRLTTTETSGTLQRIFDYSSRADPYPLYAELRETPVARQQDGSYVISTYREITHVLNDPHLSSDVRNLSRPPSVEGGAASSFIHMDPPEHDRLRRTAMRHFGPPHTPGLVTGFEGFLTTTVGSLIDDLAGKERIDVVDDFAFPLPVAVICHLLGVPREDEPRFHLWVNDIMNSVDYDPKTDPREKLDKGVQARKDLRQCLGELVQQRHGRPGDDLLSRLANDDGPDGRMADTEIVATAKLLLIAGHETAVNLITNGMLTLLRHPQVLRRLRDEPGLIVPLVEELLRYEPPVQIIPWRAAYSDIAVGDTVIPKGSQIMLMLASGSRDPNRFHDPDRFDPDRRDNQHLGFGSGTHLCFGGPLARLETQIALTELVRRLDHPSLVTDPPPYRPSPVLRGPIHLDIEQGDGFRDSQGQLSERRLRAWNEPQTHSTSETMCGSLTGPGSGVREDTEGADRRGLEGPTAAITAATSSSLTPASASTTRSSASLTSVRVTTRSRRRTRVPDRQRQQLLARRADLDGRIHLRAGIHAQLHPGLPGDLRVGSGAEIGQPAEGAEARQEAVCAAARGDEALDAVQAAPDGVLRDREDARAIVVPREQVLLHVEAGEVAVVEPLRLHELELTVEVRVDGDEHDAAVGAVVVQGSGLPGTTSGSRFGSCGPRGHPQRRL